MTVPYQTWFTVIQQPSSSLCTHAQQLGTAHLAQRPHSTHIIYPTAAATMKSALCTRNCKLTIQYLTLDTDGNIMHNTHSTPLTNISLIPINGSRHSRYLEVTTNTIKYYNQSTHIYCSKPEAPSN
jgi:hypothetical protein